MYTEDKIRFDNAIPDLGSILQEIQKITGLNDIKWDTPRNVLIHPYFNKREFFFYFDENLVGLGRGWDDRWYLLDAAMVALINLGGIYSGEVSELGRKKWKDVQNLYPIVTDP